jgi:cold-inducible RNA-binding protein
MNIYVGNLAHEATEDEVREAFAAFGKVSSAKIIMDRETGQPRGFAFVEMPDDGEGQAAIDGMNGKQFKGRTLRVNLGQKKEDRPGGGFGGGGGRSGGGFRPGGGGGSRDRGPRGNY